MIPLLFAPLLSLLIAQSALLPIMIFNILENDAYQVNTESVNKWLNSMRESARYESYHDEVSTIMRSSLQKNQSISRLEQPCSWYIEKRMIEDSPQIPHIIVASLAEIGGRCYEKIDIHQSTAFYYQAATEWSAMFPHDLDPLGKALIYEATSAESQQSPRVTASILEITKRLRPNQIKNLCAHGKIPQYGRMLAEWKNLTDHSCSS